MKFFQINDLIDSIMPKVKPNTFKVILAVARMTWGWQKEKALLSISDFQRITGIKSREGTRTALMDAMDLGYIGRISGGPQTFQYFVITIPKNSIVNEPTIPNFSMDHTKNWYGTVPNFSTVYSSSKERKNIKKERKEEKSPPPISVDDNKINLINALVEVTGMDGHKFYHELNQAAGELLEAGYSAAQIRAHYAYANNPNGHWNYFHHDWRGQKNPGDFVRLQVIWETISGATKWAKKPDKPSLADAAMIFDEVNN